jgi:hypothetical protein
MANLNVHALMPFVPARDFALARRFYAALGFVETFTSDDLVGFRLESVRFLLSTFYRPELAQNFMLTLMVEDVDAWWHHLEAMDLPAAFPGVTIKAPADYAWGLREIHLIDPSGVCWHIAQPIPAPR